MPTIPYKNAAGKRISGSTTITGTNLGWNKETLKWWANSEGLAGRSIRDTSAKACDAGTIAHYLIECDIKDWKPDVVSEFGPRFKVMTEDLVAEVLRLAENSFGNFVNWKKQMKIHVVETEIHLVSEKFQYGLTPDAIIRIGGKKGDLCLFDWKTGKGPFPDHILQLASYKHGWEEVHPDMPLIGGYHLLQIPKETAAWHHHHWGHDQLELGWEVFLYLLEVNARKKAVEALC